MRRLAVAILFLLVGAAKDWRQPAKVISQLKLKNGDRVAILGAGGSYLATRLSKAVGPTGMLYLVDSDPALIQNFDRTIASEPLANTTAILATEGEPNLPQQVNLILVVNGYRYIDRREVFFPKLKRQLTAGGRLVIIDFYRRPMRIGPPLKERVASHRVLKELDKSGFRLAKRYNVLPYQYFLVFAPKT